MLGGKVARCGAGRHGAQSAIVVRNAEGDRGAAAFKDYARRGFVDGRVVRLPTISVRPGKPNAAASSFASGIIREPLNGERGRVPGRRLNAAPGCSRRTKRDRDALIAGLELNPAALGRLLYVVSLPGLSVSVGEMVAALRECGPGERSRREARSMWQRGWRVGRRLWAVGRAVGHRAPSSSACSGDQVSPMCSAPISPTKASRFPVISL